MKALKRRDEFVDDIYDVTPNDTVEDCEVDFTYAAHSDREPLLSGLLPQAESDLNDRAPADYDNAVNFDAYARPRFANAPLPQVETTHIWQVFKAKPTDRAAHSKRRAELHIWTVADEHRGERNYPSTPPSVHDMIAANARAQSKLSTIKKTRPTLTQEQMQKLQIDEHHAARAEIGVSTHFNAPGIPLQLRKSRSFKELKPRSFKELPSLPFGNCHRRHVSSMKLRTDENLTIAEGVRIQTWSMVRPNWGRKCRRRLTREAPDRDNPASHMEANEHPEDSSAAETDVDDPLVDTHRQDERISGDRFWRIKMKAAMLEIKKGGGQ